jgi:hypothetical protein
MKHLSVLFELLRIERQSEEKNINFFRNSVGNAPKNLAIQLASFAKLFSGSRTVGSRFRLLMHVNRSF